MSEIDGNYVVNGLPFFDLRFSIVLSKWGDCVNIAHVPNVGKVVEANYTPAAAREIAAQLIKMADEIEAMPAESDES